MNVNRVVSLKLILTVMAVSATVFTFYGCIFDTSNGLRPGVYRGDYGGVTQVLNFESEMVLDENGRFRFFEVIDDAPYRMFKGEWGVTGEVMTWRNVSSAYSFDDNFMDFYEWDTVAADTFFLRDISVDAFERLEVAWDTTKHPFLRWVRYRRETPPAVLADGRYEYSEIYRNWLDSSGSILGRAFIELTRGGVYRDGRFADGKPVYESEGTEWIQAGSFVVSMHNRWRFYIDSLSDFEEWQKGYSDYEYVFHIREVEKNSFQSWQAPRASYQDGAYWAAYGRVSGSGP